MRKQIVVKISKKSLDLNVNTMKSQSFYLFVCCVKQKHVRVRADTMTSKILEKELCSALIRHRKRGLKPPLTL